MSITDELRKYADDIDKKAAMKSEHGFSPIGMRLSTIADRIDEEYEHVVGFCKRLEDAAAKHEDVEIFGVEYTALPFDADGVPIHLGDKLNGYDKPITASRMVVSANGWLLQDTGGAFWYDPTNLRHVKPTVEDMLIKMLEKAVGYSDAHTTVAYGAVSEYARRIKEMTRDAQ